FDLVAGKSYYVTVPTGAIMDFAGNSFAGILTSTAFNFSTSSPADTTAPTLRMALPVDDATTVQVDSDIVLGFSEEVQRGSGNIEIHRASDGSIAQTIAASDTSQVILDEGVVTINPAQNLEGSTGYYLIIQPGAFTDLAGNPFAGITSSTALNF